jgi:hypothetical protein
MPAETIAHFTRELGAVSLRLCRNQAADLFELIGAEDASTIPTVF